MTTALQAVEAAKSWGDLTPRAQLLLILAGVFLLVGIVLIISRR